MVIAATMPCCILVIRMRSWGLPGAILTCYCRSIPGLMPAVCFAYSCCNTVPVDQALCLFANFVHRLCLYISLSILFLSSICLIPESPTIHKMIFTTQDDPNTGALFYVLFCQPLNVRAKHCNKSRPQQYSSNMDYCLLYAWPCK